ncbi:unnamed protein product [Eruca vesicaria subsp. sativa]|uniref:Poly A polymerase head domain-containing protein n=1 Tax=Eruca vesicaria subsp. sativa TaxID=29727 RepID=A0ABC8J5X1_ERUVS|nr:unnamed protein product [Eruca vesicaria subsp. sativa]
MRIYNQWIDFVNLRCEEYTENTRIPTMKFGTAKEDAYRRDLTINSLFYNLNTGSVEDLTEIGARFGFTLDEQVKQAASSEEVRIALGEKNSRERIGNETGNGPASAVTHLADLKLFGVVFALPSSSEPAPSENFSRFISLILITLGNLANLGEERRLALYAALFLPFRKTVYKHNKGKQIPLVNHIFKFSMKRKTSEAETVINIHRTTERFLTLIASLQLKNDVQLDKLDWAINILEHWESISLGDPELPATSKIRVLTRFLLRDIKNFWRVTLLTSLLMSTVDGMKEDQESCGHLDFQLDKLRKTYLTIEETIRELGLDDIWDVKPLVNGREIMLIAELSGGSSLIREWQQKLLIWQLAYPNGSAEACKGWMREIQAKRQRTE